MHVVICVLQRCQKRNVEHDQPIVRYYERLATIQARGSQPSQQVLCDILKEVQSGMVPRGLIKEWAMHCFPDATDYWVFRKNVIIYILYFCLATSHIFSAVFVFFYCVIYSRCL